VSFAATLILGINVRAENAITQYYHIIIVLVLMNDT